MLKIDRMNPQVIEELIKQLEHLAKRGNVEMLQNRKQMNGLTNATPVITGQFLDFHLLSRKDTMEASTVCETCLSPFPCNSISDS